MMRNTVDQEFIPHKILKVYKQRYGDGYYLEQCNVSVKDGEIIVGPGKPLSKSAVRRIAGSASKEEFTKVLRDPIMDSGILYFNPLFHKRFILWYRPQRKYKFNIRKEEYNIYMPSLIFMVVFDKLHIFATSTNSRPKLDTQLYIAPVLNLSDSTKFCWGSVRTANDIFDVDDEVRFWENKIWNSEFSHIGSKCSESEIMSVYKSLNGTANRFPKKELISLDTTLEETIKRLRP